MPLLVEILLTQTFVISLQLAKLLEIFGSSVSKNVAINVKKLLFCGNVTACMVSKYDGWFESIVDDLSKVKPF